MSNILWIISMAIGGCGVFWGIFVGQFYQRWKLSYEVAFGLAVLPPFGICITLNFISYLLK